MGATHDVKNSNTSKNGAATELFKFMTVTECRTHNKKPLNFKLLWDDNDLQKSNYVPALTSLGPARIAVNIAKLPGLLYKRTP